MDELAAAFHAQLAALSGAPEFPSWQRDHPPFKQRLSGFLATAQGVRHITVLLDTGATHCFICARLAMALDLRPSGHQGPTSVATAATGGTLGLAAPVLIHLGLGDAFHESMSVSPMDMDIGLILGWDWISSHDLHHLFQEGRVALRSGHAQLQLPLLPVAARPPPASLSTVMAHGELRRRSSATLRRRSGPAAVAADPAGAEPSRVGGRSKGW